jgi:hypothetical protein
MGKYMIILVEMLSLPPPTSPYFQAQATARAGKPRAQRTCRHGRRALCILCERCTWRRLLGLQLQPVAWSATHAHFLIHPRVNRQGTHCTVYNRPRESPFGQAGWGAYDRTNSWKGCTVARDLLKSDSYERRSYMCQRKVISYISYTCSL